MKKKTENKTAMAANFYENIPVIPQTAITGYSIPVKEFNIGDKVLVRPYGTGSPFEATVLQFAKKNNYYSSAKVKHGWGSDWYQLTQLEFIEE